MTTHALKTLIVLLLALALAACGATSAIAGWISGPPTAALRQLRIVTEAGANHDSATRIDLVLVFDQAAIASLPKTAPEWFAQKQALLDGMAGGLAADSLQVPPAYLLDPVPLPAKAKKALAVYLYADMRGKPGQHVLDLTHTKSAEVRLRTDDFLFTALN